MTEEQLSALKDMAREAEDYFFPGEGTETGSGALHDIVFGLTSAIRALVAEIRKTQH